MSKTKQSEVLEGIMNRLDNLEGEMESINEVFSELSAEGYCQVSGGLRVLFDRGDDKAEAFYMVSDFSTLSGGNYAFYHLMHPNEESITLDSFPPRKEKESLKSYITRVEKTGKWNKVHEEINNMSVGSVQTLGYFTYKKAQRLEQNIPVEREVPQNVLEYKPRDA